jgi:Uncharacterized protein conserved in bacteria (DUF2188)
MATRTRYAVLPAGDQWELRKGDKKMSLHDRQADAVKAGRKAAAGDKPSQLVVHGADGRIQDESTYRDDPYPPKG